jgi:hypothetical protein
MACPAEKGGSGFRLYLLFRFSSQKDTASIPHANPFSKELKKQQYTLWISQNFTFGIVYIRELQILKKKKIK